MESRIIFTNFRTLSAFLEKKIARGNFAVRQSENKPTDLCSMRVVGKCSVKL